MRFSAFLFLLLLSSWAQANPITGTYTDGETKVILTQSGSGISGTIYVDGEEFNLQVMGQKGSTLKARIDFFGMPADFILTINDKGLTLKDQENEAFLPRAGSGHVATPTRKAPPTDESFNDDFNGGNEQWGGEDFNAGEENADWGMGAGNTPPPSSGFGGNPAGGSTVEGKVFKAASKMKMGQKVKAKHEGYSFRVPAAWKGKQVDDGYMLGHDTTYGAVLITSTPGATRAQALEEARKQCAEGMKIKEGLVLQNSLPLQTIGNDMLVTEFSGGTEEHLTAYLIVKFSEHSGIAVTVITTTSHFTDEHRIVAQAVINSAKLFKPVPRPRDKQWERKLTNRKLSYLYSSSSSGYDGSYTGSSTTIRIGLCPGHFTYYSNDSYTVNAGMGVGSNTGSGSTAVGHSSGKGQGTWKVEKRGNRSTLVLDFHDGTVREYNLSKDEGKTYLDGTRYFNTGGDQGPSCD